MRCGGSGTQSAGALIESLSGCPDLLALVSGHLGVFDREVDLDVVVGLDSQVPTLLQPVADALQLRLSASGEGFDHLGVTASRVGEHPLAFGDRTASVPGSVVASADCDPALHLRSVDSGSLCPLTKLRGCDCHLFASR